MEKIITALKLIAIQLERANELKELELSNKFQTNLENKFFETKKNKLLKEIKNDKTLS
jgi:hypothetical protein